MFDEQLRDFLLENSVHITSEINGRMMIADEMYEVGGEFAVYENKGRGNIDIYRGNDLQEAMKAMNE